jgi:hypothetical protein
LGITEYVIDYELIPSTTPTPTPTPTPSTP